MSPKVFEGYPRYKLVFWWRYMLSRWGFYAYYAGNPYRQYSTIGYIFRIYGVLVSWSFMLQAITNHLPQRPST